ncbi:MAG: von Willebrand factor type A domain-containing protein, partial [Planctomycetota bacterium]|nr:von Willebrand factor type A domain-containing protein [Planctomycetota bacterium]
TQLAAENESARSPTPTLGFETVESRHIELDEKFKGEIRDILESSEFEILDPVPFIRGDADSSPADATEEKKNREVAQVQGWAYWEKLPQLQRLEDLEKISGGRVYHELIQLPGVDGIPNTFDDRLLLAGGGMASPTQGGEPASPSAELFLPPGASGINFARPSNQPEGSLKTKEEARHKRLRDSQAQLGRRQQQLWRRLARDERPLRDYTYFRSLDPHLTTEQFRARRLRVAPPSVGDDGLGREGFRQRYGVNPFVATRTDAESTFGLDVDTASYALARGQLRANRLPPKESVRVEEFVNSFPEEVVVSPDEVFAVSSEGGPAPFGAGLELLKISVKSRTLRPGERRDAVLTFCVDTSGSMARGVRSGAPSSLDLARDTLKLLVGQLQPADRVTLVAFGANAFVLLPQTPVRERERILSAVDSLAATGGTNVEAGLDLAYRLADETLQRRGENRVILLSDGVANVGARGPEEILRKVKVFSARGIHLSAVGFGEGGDGDAMLQKLADSGGGNYHHVDSLKEAGKVFADNLPRTLQVLAEDAKIQVHFDKDVVQHYRLLGYEKRDIADKDFRNDRIDAGEVGPGSTVTVLYEVLRHPAAAGSLGKVTLRYRDTGTRRVEERQFDIPPGVLARRLEETTDRFRFVAAVAELAELLRESYYARDGSLTEVLRLLGSLSPAYRERPDVREVVELTARARMLSVTRLAREAARRSAETPAGSR